MDQPIQNAASSRAQQRGAHWWVPAGAALAGGLGVWLGTRLGLPGWGTWGWTLAVAGGAAWLHERQAGVQRRAVQHAVAIMGRLAEGGSEAVQADELQPLGEFGALLQRFCQRQHRVDSSVESFLGHLEVLPQEIGRVNQSVEGSSARIEEAVEETASLLAHINSSIRSINAEVESLSRSTEEASTSILQMQSSTDEVARNAGALHDAADASTSSVHEISASIRQVAESADAVQGMAEESAAAMVEMDRTIQQVSQHVADASQLTETVSSGADEGSRAVATTIDGIAEIRRQTSKAKEVLERLNERIGEIGQIVTVIGGINDETNLLSLNAAIIAAQAGEQGKAFAVVANHVKTLAQRTASSTKEIEELIHAVQEQSRKAVEAMGAGMEAVETGVERSRKAGTELHTIRESARAASERVSEIARATGEQSRNSKHVAEAAQRTSSMVQQITAAMAEQSRASESMLQNAESSLELCRQVHRSTEEQRESGRFITASISAITEMIHSIQRNTESHSAASEAMSEAVTRILEIAREGGSGSRQLLEHLDALRSEAQALARCGSGEAEPLASSGRPG